MGIQDENNQECLVMGKGVAFGKKVGQTVPVTAEAKVYSLKEMTERGEAKDILKSVSPLCLEFANEVLNSGGAGIWQSRPDNFFLTMQIIWTLRSAAFRMESRSATR